MRLFEEAAGATRRVYTHRRRPARGGGSSTSQGHPYAIFRRVLERGNRPAAEAAAKELPRVSLGDALELTLLIAKKEPRRHPRVAARWLLRYLEERPEATIAEAGMVAACLAALTGVRHEAAAETLRGVAGISADPTEQTSSRVGLDVLKARRGWA